MDKKFYINIKGGKHAVSPEVYKAHRKFNNQLWYLGYTKKSEKITINEDGKITIEVCPEDSLEHLTAGTREFPDANSLSVENYIEMKLMLEFALNCLPTNEKKLIDLRFFQGYSVIELSKILKMPIRTLHKRISDILSKLNEILSD